jgi:hypothetical protein
MLAGHIHWRKKVPDGVVHQVSRIAFRIQQARRVISASFALLGLLDAIQNPRIEAITRLPLLS